MAIQVHCLGCDGRSMAPDSMAGKSGRCPKCGSRVRVPGEATPPEPVAAVSAPVAVAAVPVTAVRRMSSRRPLVRGVGAGAPSRRPLARGADAGPRSPHRSWVAVGALGVVVAAGVALFFYHRNSGHESPEAVLRTAEKAIREKDYRTFYGCVRPADRGYLVASSLLGAQMMVAFQEGLKTEGGATKAEVEEVLKKHGLTQDTAMAAAMKAAEPGKATTGPDIDDPEQLFVDLFTLMAKGKDDGGMKFNLAPQITNLVVEGDKAHGDVGSDGQTSRLSFVREGGDWYLCVKD